MGAAQHAAMIQCADIGRVVSCAALSVLVACLSVLVACLSVLVACLSVLVACPSVLVNRLVSGHVVPSLDGWS